MYGDPAQALEEIKRRGLPDVIAAIWEGRAPRRFLTELARPDQFFRERENLRGGRYYLPLLESDREIIYALDVSNGTYLVHVHAHRRGYLYRLRGVRDDGGWVWGFGGGRDHPGRGIPGGVGRRAGRRDPIVVRARAVVVVASLVA